MEKCVLLWKFGQNFHLGRFPPPLLAEKGEGESSLTQTAFLKLES